MLATFSSTNEDLWVWLGYSFLFLVQMGFILGLQRSRLRYRSAKQLLDLSHQELERRVEERTHSLRTINEALEREVRNHEQTETRLLETQAFTEAILNAMPTLLVGVDTNMRVTHWNKTAESLTAVNAEAALGASLLSLHPYFQPLEPVIRDTLVKQHSRTLERLRVDPNADGPVYFDVAVYPYQLNHQRGAVIRLEDATLKVRFEMTLVQSEKMLSMGELAAGLAHEINNPLASILQGAQNVQRRLDPNLDKNRRVAATLQLDLQKMGEYLKQRHITSLLAGIRETGERAAAMVVNMLEFSRPPRRHSDAVDIHLVLDHTLSLIKASLHQYPHLGRTLDIETHFDAEPPLIQGNASELQQVFLNLIRNALQAMDRPEQSMTARLRVLTHRTNDKVQILIEDNGAGMDEQTLHHLFEPFFTTKEVGQGTGLGLSVSYFIINKHHGGQIDVESRPGEGSRFTVTLNGWQEYQSTPSGTAPED